MTVAFDSGATQALVNLALQQLQYSNTSDTPPVSVQIDWAFNDGNTGMQGDGGALSVTGSTTVKIVAVNDAPTLVTPPAVTYIDTSVDDMFADTTGTLVGSDTEGSALTYGITGGTVAADVISKVGLYGTLALNISSGTYTFTPNDAAIEALKTTAADSFTVSVNDGSSTTTKTLTVSITGADDAGTFVTGGTTGNVTEDGTLVTTGNLQVGDRDAADAVFVAQSLVGHYGSFNIDSAGAWSYSLDQGAALVNNLNTGQQLTESFSVATVAGLNENVVIDISGHNDAPVDFAPQSWLRTTSLGAGNDEGRSVAIQPDGKIVVAGYSFNGSSNDFALVRYSANGTLDTNFGDDGKVITYSTSDDQGQSVTVQPDGKILVAGTSGGQFALVRYDVNGSLDTNFDGDGKVTTSIGSGGRGNSATLQPDGKILVAGYSFNGSNSDIALVRYNTNGSLDASFDGDGKVTTAIAGTSSDQGNSVTIQPDGKILVAGLSHNGYNSDLLLVRYNANGSLDTSFDGDGKVITAIGTGNDPGQSVTLQPDGKILVAGYSNSGLALVRYNPNGSLDTSFDGDGKVTTDFGSSSDYGQSVALQSDGKILVAGYSSNGTNYDFALVRYNTNGSLDNSFDIDGKVTTAIGTGYDYGYSVALQPDGKIVVVGSSSNGSDNDFAVVSYNPDGSFGVQYNPPKFTENGPAVLLISDVQIYDPELTASGNYKGASVTLSRHSGANAEDQFSIGSGFSGLTEGSVLIAGGSSAIGVVTQNSGGTLKITFNSNATQTLVDAVLSGIQYQNTSDNPPTSAQIDWVFSDGFRGVGGAGVLTGATTVTITPVNDAPTGTTGLISLSSSTEHILSIANFGFADAEDGADLTAVRIDTLPTLGKLFYLGGWLNTAGFTVSAADLASGDLTYRADTSDGSFTFSVKDSAGLYDTTPNSLSFHVNAPHLGGATISGTPTQGQMLTANNTLTDADGIPASGLGAVAYQWLADGAAISGATSTTLTLTQAQVGSVISVKASYTDSQGTPESVTSSPTAAVANVNDAPTGSVTISGSATDGQVLTVSHTLADADGLGTVGYQWFAGSQAISGATSAALALTQAQVGQAITVQALYTDGGGTAEVVSSAATSPVAAQEAQLTGQVYHWKNHALLDATVQASDTAAVVADTSLFDLRAASYNPDTGTITVELWANASTAVESFDFRAVNSQATTASFSSALPSADWTVLVNADNPTQVSVAGYLGNLQASGTTGAVKLGTLMLTLPVGSSSSFTSFDGVYVGGTAAQAQALSLAAQDTGASGQYQLGLHVGDYSLLVSRTTTDSGSAVTSADALAALRMAVGLNPNTDPDGAGPLSAPAVSPYQFMAADANATGTVTSADALAILRMAVHFSTALPQEWLFVEETRDFWDDATQSFSLTRQSAAWDHAISVGLSQDQTTNLVGVLKGDVNGSWAAPAGSTNLDVIDPGYFQNLATLTGAPVDQWGL